LPLLQYNRPMNISIIGSPGCGKTTLFQALSGIVPDSKPGADVVAMIDVPDERVDKLAKVFNPKKTIYARIALSDTVAIEEGNVRSETISPKTLREMRDSDAFILVLRNFDNGAPVDLSGEFFTIFHEFIFADILQIENRIERIRKQGGKKDSNALAQEEASLIECLEHLNASKPLATLPILETPNGKQLRGFRFLSEKPMMVVVNCDEETISTSEQVAADLRKVIPGHIPAVAASGKIEAELAIMVPEERSMFMEEYGIKESIAGRIIRLAFETLGLISFLTVGDDECRAWPIKKGMNAQEAAATIHTDLSQKFIRAETVSYDDFIRLDGFAGCKKAGVWRLEGKTYIVQDGDILNIRAGN
jgi:ribosome-binding ATPase